MKSSSRNTGDMERSFDDVGIRGGRKAATSSVEEGWWPTRTSCLAGRSCTDIEAAMNPLILCIDNTGVSIAEPQVVLNKSFNSLSLVPELPVEFLRCLDSSLSAGSYVMGFR
jgi:hypothetical protein